jgi:hypothetical protein
MGRFTVDISFHGNLDRATADTIQASAASLVTAMEAAGLEPPRFKHQIEFQPTPEEEAAATATPGS